MAIRFSKRGVGTFSLLGPKEPGTFSLGGTLLGISVVKIGLLVLYVVVVEVVVVVETVGLTVGQAVGQAVGTAVGHSGGRVVVVGHNLVVLLGHNLVVDFVVVVVDLVVVVVGTVVSLVVVCVVTVVLIVVFSSNSKSGVVDKGVVGALEGTVIFGIECSGHSSSLSKSPEPLPS